LAALAKIKGADWDSMRIYSLKNRASAAFFVEKFTPSIRPEAAPALGLRLVSHEPMLSSEKSSQRA
jgi:hypothetical protein